VLFRSTDITARLFTVLTGFEFRKTGETGAAGAAPATGGSLFLGTKGDGFCAATGNIKDPMASHKANTRT
jgi:hypothetical protein